MDTRPNRLKSLVHCTTALTGVTVWLKPMTWSTKEMQTTGMIRISRFAIAKVVEVALRLALMVSPTFWLGLEEKLGEINWQLQQKRTWVIDLDKKFWLETVRPAFEISLSLANSSDMKNHLQTKKNNQKLRFCPQIMNQSFSTRCLCSCNQNQILNQIALSNA